MRPVIEAAMKAGQPPTAMLLERPSARWTFWDYRIIKAQALLSSYEIDGWPAHMEDDPNISWTAKKRVSKSRAVVEKAQAADEKARTGSDGKVKPAHGVSFYAMPVFKDPSKRLQFREWLNKPRAEDPSAATPKGDERLAEPVTTGQPDFEMMERYRQDRASLAKSVDSTP